MNAGAGVVLNPLLVDTILQSAFRCGGLADAVAVLSALGLVCRTTRELAHASMRRVLRGRTPDPQDWAKVAAKRCSMRNARAFSSAVEMYATVAQCTDDGARFPRAHFIYGIIRATLAEIPAIFTPYAPLVTVAVRHLQVCELNSICERVFGGGARAGAATIALLRTASECGHSLNAIMDMAGAVPQESYPMVYPDDIASDAVRIVQILKTTNESARPKINFGARLIAGYGSIQYCDLMASMRDAMVLWPGLWWSKIHVPRAATLIIFHCATYDRDLKLAALFAAKVPRLADALWRKALFDSDRVRLTSALLRANILCTGASVLNLDCHLQVREFFHSLKPEIAAAKKSRRG